MIPNGEERADLMWTADAENLMLSATSSEKCQTKSPWRQLQIPARAEATMPEHSFLGETYRKSTGENTIWSDINSKKQLIYMTKAAEGGWQQQMPDSVTSLCVREGRPLVTSFQKYPRWRIEECTKLRSQGM
jgi:hypothetical protein